LRTSASTTQSAFAADCARVASKRIFLLSEVEHLNDFVDNVLGILPKSSNLSPENVSSKANSQPLFGALDASVQNL
jgi:hypothetical protein